MRVAPNATSWASSEVARRTMLANRRRDTGPEMALRRRLHAAGLRYRVDWPLPFDRRRRADIAFTRAGLVIFVDGCFWHGCPEHFVPPKANADFWDRKIQRNIERDRETDLAMADLGWVALRFWEHGDPQDACEATVRELAELVGGRYPTRAPRLP